MEIIYSSNVIKLYVYVRNGSEKMKPYYSMDKRFFHINTMDLTDHDRRDLILDYFEKIQILLSQDVKSLVKTVQELTEEKEIEKGVNRMHKSQELLYELDALSDEYAKGKSNKDRPYYSAELLKQAIEKAGYNSPTRFMQNTFVIDYTYANKKLNLGIFNLDDLYLIRNKLGLSNDEFMDIFLYDTNNDPRGL